MPAAPTPPSDTQYLTLPEGRLAYDDAGSGPLIVMTPAMLDLRAELRFIAPRLVAAGFRVVTIDQRGMGASSANWPAYGSVPMAGDLNARPGSKLLRIGGPSHYRHGDRADVLAAGATRVVPRTGAPVGCRE